MKVQIKLILITLLIAISSVSSAMWNLNKQVDAWNKVQKGIYLQRLQSKPNLVDINYLCFFNLVLGLNYLLFT